MNSIEQVLTHVPVVEGFVGLYLVDAGTGQVLATVGPPSADPDDVPASVESLAAAVTHVVRHVSGVITAGDLDEDLEDLVVTLTHHHHLVRVAPPVLGVEDAFLVLSLERARSNLALARHLLLTFEARLVA